VCEKKTKQKEKIIFGVFWKVKFDILNII